MGRSGEFGARIIAASAMAGLEIASIGLLRA
jgi:hypothetical protein